MGRIGWGRRSMEWTSIGSLRANGEAKINATLVQVVHSLRFFIPISSLMLAMNHSILCWNCREQVVRGS